MLEAHHRRVDRDAALAVDRHPIRAHPLPCALTTSSNWIAPPNSSRFSVKVVLQALGCEMTAKARRRQISPGRVLILSSLAVAGTRTDAGKRSAAPALVPDLRTVPAAN